MEIKQQIESLQLPENHFIYLTNENIINTINDSYLTNKYLILLEMYEHIIHGDSIPGNSGTNFT